MRAIDCHGHYYPAAYLSTVAELAGEAGPHRTAVEVTASHPMLHSNPLVSGLAEQRLAMMEEAGIQCQILSFASPNVWHPDPATRVRIVRSFNEGCLDLASTHPGRFLVFASVPLPHIEESIAETDDILGEPHTAGVSLCTHIDGVPIDDDRWSPLYQHWNEQGVTVFLHPDGFCVPGLLDDYGMNWTLGALFDDTIAAVRLLSSGILERYPGIRWIVPHLGGTLPFVLDRIDDRWHRDPDGTRSTSQPPSSLLSRLWLDTVTPSMATLTFAADRLGVDRLVFGTDFPFVGNDAMSKGRDLVEGASLQAQLPAVLWENATGLLPALGTSR